MQASGQQGTDHVLVRAQSLAAARNTVVQRLRAITDERKRLMAALHSFVLQVGSQHTVNDLKLRASSAQFPS